MQDRSQHSFFQDLLTKRAAESGNRLLYTFLADGEQEAQHHTYRSLYDRSIAVAQRLREQQACRGKSPSVVPARARIRGSVFRLLIRGCDCRSLPLTDTPQAPSETAQHLGRCASRRNPQRRGHYQPAGTTVLRIGRRESPAMLETGYRRNPWRSGGLPRIRGTASGNRVPAVHIGIHFGSEGRDRHACEPAPQRRDDLPGGASRQGLRHPSVGCRSITTWG